MKRREFITVGGIAALLWRVGVQAQEAGRTYRLGFVAAGPRSAPYWLEVFDELRQAGFVEGQNLTVDYHQYGPHVDLIAQFAAEVVKAKVDVIVATGDTAIRAVQDRRRQQFRFTAVPTTWSGRDWSSRWLDLVATQQA